MSCTNSTCNNVVGSANLYTGAVEYSNYGYLVNKPSSYVFLIFFAIVTVVLVLQGVYWRKWWTLYTLCIGASLEAIGWGGRYWSAATTFWDPTDGGMWDTNDQGFIMEIVCLIIAPTFFSAANYIFMGELNRLTDGKYSSVTPRSISRVFTTADFICLVIQAIGGGMTGTSNDADALTNGLHVMAVGVVLQLVVTFFFCLLYAEYCWRYFKGRPVKKQFNLLAWTRVFRCFLCGARQKVNDRDHQTSLSNSYPLGPTKDRQQSADSGQVGIPREPARKRVACALTLLATATLLIIIRSIYRCDELLTFNSGTNAIYYDQTAFIAMDASLMLALVVAYVIYHPGLVNGIPLF